VYLSNHLRQNFLPNVCWLSSTIILLLLLHVTAEAACTAGNPYSSVLENTPTTAFNGTVDDTVLHSLTGLVWDRCSLGQVWNAGSCTASATTYNWQNALKEVKIRNDANHLGHSDWRLPNRDELHSIAEDCGTDPAINQAIFPNTSMLNYWSASSYARGPGSGWVVHFGHSGTSTISKTNSYNVRLVRGGRSYDAFDLLNVKVSTSTSLNASPVSPATFGDAVTLTASVTGNTPTGTIQFYADGGVQNCDAGNQTLVAGSATCILNALPGVAGSATCILNALPGGSYNFSADYPGDSGNMSSSSDALAYVIDSGAPPVAGSVVANDVAQANIGETTYSFTIDYSDSDGNLDTLSIGNSNVTVCKVGTCATVTGATWVGDSSIGTATYTVTPPGGSWNEDDNGTYTIAILADQIKDSLSNYVEGDANAGSFIVSIVDPTVPGPPVNVHVTAANSGVLIEFDPPLSDGGASVIEYWGICNAGNTSTGNNSVESPIFLSGLSNGVTYECYATATNSVGGSEISDSFFVTPTDGGDVTLPPSDGGPGEVVTFTHTATSPNGTPVTATLEVVATDPLPSEPPPAEADSLVAAIDISSTGSVAGYKMVVTFDIDPGSMNEFTGFWKYGKETAIDAPHWYDYGTLEANGDGTGYELSDDKKTLNVYLVDGLRGDDDLLANASIVDPALPIVEVSPTVFSNGFE